MEEMRFLGLSFSLLRALRAPRARRGQTTVEYMLLLAVIVGMTLMMGVLFYRRILGGFFTLVGMIVGAGTPK